MFKLLRNLPSGQIMLQCSMTRILGTCVRQTRLWCRNGAFL